jgi:predicted membrane-bound dolichyl-phosphate-mannose-protein mannosyltransferase
MARRRSSLVTRYLRSPLGLLVVLCLLSTGARVAWLGEPCGTPCRSATQHVFVFDEVYYVNAARVIAGVHPPTGSPYADSPLGSDPNSEHPQLGKLVIAGSIELFGDGPLAWRLGSVLLGTISILGTFALVRAAGGGSWIALGAAGLMAADNLLLVHGRIGTLDMYALAAMVWGVALYLRRRPLLAGIVIGLGACAKVVALYALLVLGLMEAIRWLTSRGQARARVLHLALAAAVACTMFIGVLAGMGALARPYDNTAGKYLGSGPFAHLSHMISYAAHQTSPHGPTGIASYPWQWLGDYKPIVYLNIVPGHPAERLLSIHPAVHFLGMISPPILLLTVPALAVAGVTVVRRSRRASGRETSEGDEVPSVALAWFAGTFIPFELLSLVWNRTSYLYYMVIVMPGIYMAVAGLAARARGKRTRMLRAAWVAAVVVAVIGMYPLTPLP